MPGIQFKIDVALPTTFPRLAVDPILPTDGALLLLDFTHSANPLTATLANNLYLPNIAQEQAMRTTGATTATAVQSEFKVVNGTAGAPTYKRTSTGGIYTNQQYAGGWWPLAVVDHMLKNPEHDYYVSQWGTIDGNAAIKYWEFVANSNSDPQKGYGLEHRNSVSTVPGAATPGLAGGVTSGVIGQRTPTFTAGSPYLISAAFSEHNITGGQSAAGTRAANGMVAFGTFGNLTGNARRTYRVYTEDLTVSGRTYAEVDALDNELYAREVLTAGGRYYGDAIPA